MSKNLNELDLSSRVFQGISKMGIETLTPIQAKSWNFLMDPNVTDVIIHSETGSGKTLSYLLPLVELMMRKSRDKQDISRDGNTPGQKNSQLSRKDGTSLLIVVPVRELAQQTLAVCQQLFRFIPFLTCGLVTGGEKRTREKERLRKGQNILIATPGRLLDHIRSTQCMNLCSLRYLVVDEADRTLDEGFETDLKQLKSYLEEKQAYFGTKIEKRVLVSATLNDKILSLSYFILTKPQLISNQSTIPDAFSEKMRNGVADVHANTNTENHPKVQAVPFIFPEKLKQRYIICSPKRKLATMFALLHWIFQNNSDITSKKVIVFANSFACVDFFHLLTPLLNNPFKQTDSNSAEQDTKGNLVENVVVNKIHKEMTQLDRSSSCTSFKKSTRAILFCTDIAARGLHFENVTDVIHFDPPLSMETYIHRTGRTARIGNTGTSHLLLYPHEDGYAQHLIDKGADVQKKDTSILFYSLIKSESSGTCDLFDCQIQLQKSLENTVREDKVAYKASQDAFSSWRKAYSAYPVDQRVFFDSTKLHLRNISRSFGVIS